MYINDCIRCVRRYYPSEYDDEEMYIWCDEVSSMLAIEDRAVFREVILKSDRNGSILLPEGVNIENVVSVSVGGELLKKSDLRDMAYESGCIKNGAYANTLHRIVYLEPYQPLRRTHYSGRIKVSDNGTRLELDNNGFFAGDIISISINGGEYESESVNIFALEYTEPAVCVMTVSQTGIPDGEYSAAELSRIVTDTTVCNAPYDSMYIDYILAKINMLQRDMQGYNHHMTAFNSRLSAYRKWLINHMPQGENRLKNWW